MAEKENTLLDLDKREEAQEKPPAKRKVRLANMGLHDDTEAFSIMTKIPLAEARKWMPTGRIEDIEFVANSAPEKIRRAAEAFRTLSLRYQIQRASADGQKLYKTGKDVAELFRFASLERTESFYLLSLNSAGRLVGHKKVITGDQTKIYFSPRLIVEAAFEMKAHKVAFVHNHPDGNPKPSSNDHHAMQALYGICNSVGLNVLDSVIVAENGYYSFATREFGAWENAQPDPRIEEDQKKDYGRMGK